MCTVALNRPPTQNQNHINPPDISANRNTHVWGVSEPYIGLGISGAGTKQVIELRIANDPASFRVILVAMLPDFMLISTAFSK